MNIEGLYLHLPFCRRRCHYCDFNTYEGLEWLRPRYVAALRLEISRAAGQGPLRSVYFGGGTPSLLEASEVAELLEAARRHLGLWEGAEVTLEVDPGTASLAKLKALRRAGVNRLSFGFQARQDHHLQAMGRAHSAAESEQAWAWARRAGFTNLSLDLMFGLPGQSQKEWRESLEWALDLRPEHVSFYGLTIEEGTRWGHLLRLGRLTTPGEDEQAEMYEEGIRILESAGLLQYEISNFAHPGFESIHNRLYWLNRPVLGLGAGAWSYVGGLRSAREKSPLKYCEKVEAGEEPLTASERLEGRRALGERAWLGLRLREGLDPDLWPDLQSQFGSELEPLFRQGLLELSEGRLRLTKRGLPLANEVFQVFV